MSINWFPGHMKKTVDLIKANLKLIDIYVEVIDARIPNASRNPLFEKLLEGKKGVIAFNKPDLSDESVNLKWHEHYAKKGMPVCNINALNGDGINRLLDKIKEIYHEKEHRINRNIRIMIVGIPNVGKSTLINRLVDKRVAQVGNRPGVTKGKQWVRIREDIALFDTPGVLWHKFENDVLGYKLAICGSIKDDILNMEDIAVKLLQMLIPEYSDILNARYKIDVDEIMNSCEDMDIISDGVIVKENQISHCQALAIMEAIGRKRGCILAKNEIDYNRVSRLILDEFRKGVIGRISLETP